MSDLVENTTSEYEQQALDFLQATNTEFSTKLLDYRPYSEGDVDYRDVYEVTLKRGNREWSFEFGQSIANSRKFQDTMQKQNNGKPVLYRKALFEKEEIFVDIAKSKKSKYVRPYQQFISKKVIEGTPPTAYDVLVCLGDEVGDFEDFCDNFGYDSDSISAHQTWQKMVEQWRNTQMLFSDEEIEMLREIY